MASLFLMYGEKAPNSPWQAVRAQNLGFMGVGEAQAWPQTTLFGLGVLVVVPGTQREIFVAYIYQKGLL